VGERVKKGLRKGEEKGLRQGGEGERESVENKKCGE
jgi:hypothetical protein